jgi:hypothetical protein
MEYNKIGDWAIGYLEALSTGNVVTKPQLEKMIARIREMICDIESQRPWCSQPTIKEVDDF